MARGYFICATGFQEEVGVGHRLGGPTLLHSLGVRLLRLVCRYSCMPGISDNSTTNSLEEVEASKEETSKEERGAAWRRDWLVAEPPTWTLCVPRRADLEDSCLRRYGSGRPCCYFAQQPPDPGSCLVTIYQR